MPEYDAFGREIGENTLAGLGGGAADARPAARPEPAEEWASAATVDDVPIAPAAEPSARQPSFTVAGRSGATRRGRGVRGLGCLVSLVVLAAIVAAPIAALVSFVDDAGDAITEVTDRVERPGATAGPGGDGAEEPPTGLGGASLLRAENLQRALRVVRRRTGDLERVTIWPDRVDATLVTRRDNERSFAVTYRGEEREGEPHDVGIPRDTLRWSDVDPRVPARLVRNAAARGKLQPDRIDYVIGQVDVFNGGPIRWIAYFKGGRIFEGDSRGKVLRRIS